MTGEEFTDGESDFERRSFLKALGAGSGVIGFSGLASADDTLSVSGSELVSADRAAAEFDAATSYDYYTRLAEFMAGDSLEAYTENVFGYRIETSDEELNARNPVILSLPYRGPEGKQQGFLWVTQIDDADGNRRPNGGVGTSVETVDGEHRHRIYGWENEAPAILASEPVSSTSTSNFTTQSWCSACTWVIDVICDYGLYWLGEEGCNYICWSYKCEQSCEALIDWLNRWLCSWYSPEDICSAAGAC
ncbi:twin-arginine translocation signal domain-containing protein [Halorussus sp. MSC15.2]|uniref:twin-arginine translocation signal domain-containing protein n=1 Tax=Halorussus sp. MSC15.2 TaxID=2283638 RepID=UPI0013CF7B41|nr:twin-arginine translocation signal domain-containing protein [Halorussus sp. MSC15.2]NEU57151.1 twin-arginine translocation signal domain-containing protein [Halorussus sp. MSC15.2]